MGTLLHSCVRTTRSSQVTLGGLVSLLQVTEAPITIDDNDEDSESPLASRKVGRSGRRRVKDLSVRVFL